MYKGLRAEPHSLEAKLEDVRLMVILKHLPGQHDQQRHDPHKGRGAAPTTQAELNEYIAYRKELGHDKDLDEESQKYWDMAMDDIQPLDLKDNVNDIKPVTAKWAHGRHMRGYLITPEDELSEVSSEFGGGTNDHVGNMMMSSTPETFGVSAKAANNAMADYMDMSGGMEGYLTQAWSDAYQAGTVRVRESGKNTAVETAYMDNKTLKRMQKLYDQDKFAVNYDGDVIWEGSEGRDAYVIASSADFMSATSVGDLKRRSRFKELLKWFGLE